MSEPLDLDELRALYEAGDCNGGEVGPLLDLIERLRAALDEARARAVNGGEWGWQYGHELEAFDGWVFEPRGARYASSRRRWWMGPPERISPGPVELVTDDGGTDG